MVELTAVICGCRMLTCCVFAGHFIKHFFEPLKMLTIKVQLPNSSLHFVMPFICGCMSWVRTDKRGWQCIRWHITSLERRWGKHSLVSNSNVNAKVWFNHAEQESRVVHGDKTGVVSRKFPEFLRTFASYPRYYTQCGIWAGTLGLFWGTFATTAPSKLREVSSIWSEGGLNICGLSLQPRM